MEVPNAQSEGAVHARVSRRWRGLGAILFLGFYSLYFAAHVRLSDTVVYLKDDALSSARTSMVFTDLITARSDERRLSGSAHPLFTLFHQPAAQLAILGWERLSQDTNSARKHAVAVLTAGAGALTVLLLYHTLLWTGVSMGRSVLAAAIQGGSTMAAVWAAVPEVWVFCGLGLMAMLWAVARGRSGRWWELPLAIVYAVGCWAWLAIPAVFLLLMAEFRAGRLSSWFGRLFSVLGSLAVIVSALLALNTLQRVLYPRVSNGFEVAALQEEVEIVSAGVQPEAWSRERVRRLIQSSGFTAVVAPEAVVKERPLGKAGPVRRSVSFQDDRWLQMDFHHAVWGAWALLLVLGLGGLPVMARHAPGMVLALLGVVAFVAAFLLFYQVELDRFLFGSLATPILVAVVGIGLEGAVRFWRGLALPVGLLALVFLGSQMTRNWQLVLELDSMLKL